MTGWLLSCSSCWASQFVSTRQVAPDDKDQHRRSLIGARQYYSADGLMISLFANDKYKTRGRRDRHTQICKAVIFAKYLCANRAIRSSEWYEL